MKWMLMMNVPGAEDYQVPTWKPEEIVAHMGFMHDLNAHLTETGEIVDTRGLAAPSQVKVVTSGPDGAPVVTDGPFPEAKEFLAGYWIIETDSAERTYEIAARISSAPGPGGAPLHLPIEVREVLSPVASDDISL
jgi:hypothetical protein